MANNTIYFQNPRTGQVRSAPVGFSWTVFFFGPFPLLFRSSWKWAAIIFIAALVTSGISSVIFSFFINKLYIGDLLCEGFEVKSVEKGSAEQALASMGIAIPRQA